MSEVVDRGVMRLMRGDAGGAGQIEAAAAEGSVDALLAAATLAAAGIGRPQDWRLALDRLADAADRGSPRAQGQLQVLSGQAGSDWRGQRRAIDIAAWTAPQARTPAAESPRIRVAEGFLPKAACEWLMTQALGRLSPSTMYNPATGRDEPHPRRTNSVFLFDLARADVVTAAVRARVSATVGIPLPCFEPTQIFHYARGQEIGPHYDFLERNRLVSFEDAQPYEGQRIATFLIYLNDDYEGGETTFPKVGWSFKARAGDAIFFANVDKEGQPDRLSLHAGTPPISGEKWIISQWIHNQTFTGMNG